MLSQFKQITFELHGMTDGRTPFDTVLAMLEKLNKTHQLIHLHGQNIGTYISVGTKTFCNQIEASYVLRDKYILNNDYDVNLPLNIDMPARHNIPEVILGHWNRDIKTEDEFTQITRVFY